MRYPPSYRFPPGYRFLPTDEELLSLLKEKIDNPITNKCQMIIAEPNFFKKSPETLVNTYRSRGENSWYFFTSRDRKYKNGKRPDRRAGNGFYRASATVKPVCNKNGKKIGSKRSLVYYEGDHRNSVKTNWLMTEYVIKEHRISINNQTNSMKLDDCVVYKIYYNHKKSKNRQLEQGESSKSQYQGEGGGGGGHEIDTQVQDQGVMVNFVEQAKVETEIGISVDKGKGVLQEEDDSVDQYLNYDRVNPSCHSSSLGYFDNNNGYVSNHNMPTSSNGQFNNDFNFDIACQNGGDFINQSTQVYGVTTYFDRSENGGYDDQLGNMQVNDQLNSLKNNASCSFNYQSAEGDGNQFDNSLDSQSNGNDIAGYSYDEQFGIMQF